MLHDIPEHLALLRALSRLDFQFDRPAGRRSAQLVRGFAPESVVEVVEGPPLTVSLLFSASPDQPSLVCSTMSLVTLSRVLSIDFTDWLARQISRRGLGTPWAASRRFGTRQVAAELLGSDAILLTITAARR